MPITFDFDQDEAQNALLAATEALNDAREARGQTETALADAQAALSATQRQLSQGDARAKETTFRNQVTRVDYYERLLAGQRNAVRKAQRKLEKAQQTADLRVAAEVAKRLHHVVGERHAGHPASLATKEGRLLHGAGIPIIVTGDENHRPEVTDDDPAVIVVSPDGPVQSVADLPGALTGSVAVKLHLAAGWTQSGTSWSELLAEGAERLGLDCRDLRLHGGGSTTLDVMVIPEDVEVSEAPVTQRLVSAIEDVVQPYRIVPNVSETGPSMIKENIGTVKAIEVVRVDHDDDLARASIEVTLTGPNAYLLAGVHELRETFPSLRRYIPTWGRTISVDVHHTAGGTLRANQFASGDKVLIEMTFTRRPVSDA